MGVVMLLPVEEARPPERRRGRISKGLQKEYNEIIGLT
jgi:hypothetical protein